MQWYPLLWTRPRPRSALVVFFLAALAAPAAAAPAPPDDLAAWDRRIAGALQEGRVEDARAWVLPALDAARVASPDAAFYPAYVDSLARGFFAAGGDSMGVVLFERGVAARDSVFGPDNIVVAAPLENLAVAYYLVGRVADAVAPLERAHAIYAGVRGVGDPATARCGYTLALVYYLLTRYGEAETELRASLAAQEAVGDSLTVAETERMLGEVCRELNRYGEAETHMQRAVAIADDALSKDDPGRVTFLNSLAGFYRDQARYDEAEYLIEEAIDIRSRAGLENQLANPTLNLAEIYRYQGRYDDALPLYQRALALAQQYLTPLEVAEFHNQLAAVYGESGALDEAAAQYEKALALVRDSPHASPQVVAQFEHDYGVLLFRRGERAAGEEMLENAIARRESVFGPSHPLVAASLIELARETMTSRDGRVAAAGMLDRAIAMLDSSDAEPEAEADARAARADLFALENRRDAAIAEMASALAIVESLRPHRGGGSAERVAFMGRYRGYYDRMTGWEIQAGDPAAALAYSERMRARVLVERLTRGDGVAAAVEDDVADRLRARETDLARRLEECQARVRELRAIARPSRSQREELARSEAACDGLVEDLQRVGERMQRVSGAPPQPETIAADDIAPMARRVIAHNGALVAYHLGRDASHVFVMPAGATLPACHALIVSEEAAARLGIAAGALTRAALTRALTGLDENGRSVGLGVLRSLSEPPPPAPSNAVAARALRDQEARLHALFSVLVPAAAWKSMRSAADVVIVPDGPLFALPFEALVTEVSSGRAQAWIDDGPVVRYAPSLALLDAIGRADEAATRKRPAVLSVCNPRFAAGDGAADAGTAAWVARTRYGERGGSLAALPGTELETNGVVETFGAGAVTVLRGADATERALRDAIPGKDVVHLATHGLVSLRRSDLLAALALTPVSTSDLSDDGFLQMFEIYNLPISARLVVLSACESSHGRYVEGEGVMALSNGFHAAGARQVVATLWKVDDDASAALMDAFFARVAAGWDNGGDVARALRDAKRALRADPRRAHPFYWAAFVASGRP